MDLESIGKSSPLYEYWQSAQGLEDERKRLQKLCNESPAAALFKSEPYKWEILFQSIIREILKGDVNSINGFKVLLCTLNKDVRKKLLNDLQEKDIFTETTIARINCLETTNVQTKKNLFRFLRIFIAIFTNPYDLEMKGKKAHVYEYTGFIFFYLKKIISNILHISNN